MIPGFVTLGIHASLRKIAVNQPGREPSRLEMTMATERKPLDQLLQELPPELQLQRSHLIGQQNRVWYRTAGSSARMQSSTWEDIPDQKTDLVFVIVSVI